MSPFEVLGFSKSFNLDLDEIEKRYYELSRQLHPDHILVTDPKIKLEALEKSALLNQAYLKLKNPEKRLEALLELVGVPEQFKSERLQDSKNIPHELAEKFFELQENGLNSPEATSFKAALKVEKEAVFTEIFSLAVKINWDTPAVEFVQKILNLKQKLSYIRSLVQNLERHQNVSEL